MKLLIAVPSFDTMRAEFVRSLMELTSWLWENHVQHEVKILTGSLVYGARDKLARHAIKNNFDEVLWIDSDMVFDRHLYEDLKMCGQDRVCGLFISRHYPYVSCLFSSISPVERINEYPDEAFEVTACGFGCVLMKTKILEDVMNQNSGVCFLPEQKLGEDIAFCVRARSCGYHVWCEPTARVGHMGSVIIWPEDAERLRGDIQGLEGRKVE
jgi:hypothetical protein